MSPLRVTRTTTVTMPGSGGMSLGDLRALVAQLDGADDACRVTIRQDRGDQRDQRDTGSTTITVTGVGA